MARIIPHIFYPTRAEATVLWHGVNLCIELGYQQVIFEVDSLRVVQALPQASPCLSPFGHLLDDIRTRLSGLHFGEVHHIYREANLVAHNLAKLAISSSMDHVWLEDYPSVVCPFVLAEQGS
jgi:hypothetical protein